MTTSDCLALPAVGDDDPLGCLACCRAVALHLLHHVHPLHNLPEHHVLSVQPLENCLDNKN